MPAKLDNKENVLSLYGVAFIDAMEETGFFRLEEMAVRLQSINDSLLTQFVITSYSIHYTKLYDSWRYKLQGMPLSPPGSHGHREGSIDVTH